MRITRAGSLLVTPHEPVQRLWISLRLPSDHKSEHMLSTVCVPLVPVPNRSFIDHVLRLKYVLSRLVPDN